MNGAIMAEEIDQIEELSPEEQFVKDTVDGLMEKVGQEYGEPLQGELADRLEKSVNEFKGEVTEMITAMKERTDQQRSELKERWDHRNDPGLAPSGSSDETAEELSSWEKKIESSDPEKDPSPAKSKEKEEPKNEKDEKPKKKKKFGFFKKKKKEKD